jgi:pectate lyase
MKLASAIRCGVPGILVSLALGLSAACDVPEEESEAVDLADQSADVSGCAIPSYVAASPAPIGWASLNGGTRGGGSATPVVVTSLAALNAAAGGTNAAVIFVNGNLARGTVTIGSNKTIIGCSGNATLNGHVDVKRSQNVILRNLNIVGFNCAPPDVDTSNGGECQDGIDAVTIDKGSKNIWLDHDAISDGSDGNLDITHGSDFITVSYTKFFYSSRRNDPNDTGTAGHRYSNLIGGSDSNGSEDAGHLNVTWHHDWWAQNVVERQARVRFGKNHFFNDLWTSAGNNYCIGVGAGASILNENNAFVGVKTPIDTTRYVKPSVALSSARSRNNLFSGTSGAAVADLNAGSAFSPPYSYSPIAASAVQADVQANAGPK